MSEFSWELVSKLFWIRSFSEAFFSNWVWFSVFRSGSFLRMLCDNSLRLSHTCITWEQKLLCPQCGSLSREITFQPEDLQVKRELTNNLHYSEAFLLLIQLLGVCLKFYNGNHLIFQFIIGNFDFQSIFMCFYYFTSLQEYYKIIRKRLLISPFCI